MPRWRLGKRIEIWHMIISLCEWKGGEYSSRLSGSEMVTKMQLYVSKIH